MGGSLYGPQIRPLDPPRPYSVSDRYLALLQQQAALSGERSMARGNLWGNVVSGIGQTIAQAMQQQQAANAQKKQEQLLKRRDMAFMQAMEQWDGQDPESLLKSTMTIYGPDKGPQVAQGVLAFKHLAQQRELEQMKLSEQQRKELHAEDQDALKAVAKLLPNLSPESRAMLWPSIRGTVAGAVQSSFNLSPEQTAEVLPEDYGKAEEMLSGLFSEGGPWGPEAEKPVSLSPGGKLVNPQTGEVIAESPKEPKMYKVTVPGPNGQPMEKLVSEDELSAGVQGYRAPVASGSPSLTPNAEAQLINQLSGRYNRAMAPVRELERQSKNMQIGLQEAKKGNMNAGSQAVLVTFQKILDPTSVVRESEYARSPEGMALLHRIQGAKDRLVKGGPGVPVSELEKFANLAQQFVAASKASAEAEVKRVNATADRYKIPPELVSGYESGQSRKEPKMPGGFEPVGFE